GGRSGAANQDRRRQGRTAEEEVVGRRRQEQGRGEVDQGQHQTEPGGVAPVAGVAARFLTRGAGEEFAAAPWVDWLRRRSILKAGTQNASRLACHLSRQARLHQDRGAERGEE